MAPQLVRARGAYQGLFQHTHTHTHTHARMHARTHARAHARTHIHTHTHTHTRVRAHTRTHYRHALLVIGRWKRKERRGRFSVLKSEKKSFSGCVLDVCPSQYDVTTNAKQLQNAIVRCISFVVCLFNAWSRRVGALQIDYYYYYYYHWSLLYMWASALCIRFTIIPTA